MVTRTIYGEQNGIGIESILVDFEDGISVDIITYGGIIKSLNVPDANMKRRNIVLALSSLEDYIKDDQSIGCIVGRVANRIKNAEFSIDGKKYHLAKNNGENHIHGGPEGFGKIIWNLESVIENKDEVEINLSHFSKNGHEGYPGNLEVNVQYIISKDQVRIIYSARTDQRTPFNPTQHTYFNLGGDFMKMVDDHELSIESGKIIELDADSIPTGNILDVEGTVYDFLSKKLIGKNPYDICYEVEGITELSHPESGIKMKVETTAPGIQLYTGDHLSESGILGRCGVCLETQWYADSVNHSNFPSTLIQPDEEFETKTSFKFSW